MDQPSVSRRTLLTAALACTAVGPSAVGGQIGSTPMERADKFRLRPKTRDRILAGHKVILDELKPTKAQVDRGLQLHYDAFVADSQGDVSVSYDHGLLGDRLVADFKSDRYRARTFESAYDPQWIEESRALYAITNVQLGSEDVAGPNENTFTEALHKLARSNYVYERRNDLIRVSGLDDVQRGRREGKTCITFHLAGVGCFAETEDPLTNLDLFYALGVRMSQLTYIQQNALCSAWLQYEDTGLTDLGRKVVHRMNELGIMVDLAHCGHRTCLEIIAASTEPVIFSHTACKTVYDDATNKGYIDRVLAQPYARGVAEPGRTGSRNTDDEILRAMATEGGIAAFYTIDYVLGPGPESFHTWYRHLEHAIEVAGIDHVAIGSDRTFFPTWKPGPLDWTNWPYWTVGLVVKGHSDDEIRKIIGGNYLRYVEQVLDKRPWGPFL